MRVNGVETGFQELGFVGVVSGNLVNDLLESAIVLGVSDLNLYDPRAGILTGNFKILKTAVNSPLTDDITFNFSVIAA